MINVTIDYAEPLVQSIVSLKTGRWISCGTTVSESLLHYSASARVLRWGHIIWVKDSALLARNSYHIHHLFDSTFSQTASKIIIFNDIARIFHQKVIGLSCKEFNIAHKIPG